MFPVPGSTTDDRFFEIFFDVDVQAVPRPGEDVKTRRAAEVLKQNPDLVAMLEGHASTEGPAGHNQWLSEGRVATVKRLLVGAGVSADRLDTQAFGATRPAVPETEQTWTKLEEQRRKNRRVAVLIHDPSAPPVPAPPGWVFNPLQSPPPQPINPLDPAAIRKAVDDVIREKGLPPITNPQLPPWFWKELPPRDKPAEWNDYIEKLKKWCQDNHIDPNIFIQGLKDKLAPDPNPPRFAPPSDPPGWPDKSGDN